MRLDDRSLSRQELERVESAATALLHRADAWGVVPLPVDDILSAAKLHVAPYSIFDPRAIAAFAISQGRKAADVVKRAIGKIFGILDTHAEVIHIDDSVVEGRQRFLKLHETGHFQLPHQKKVFRFFEESDSELDPSVADLFEREANNFARFAIFNGDSFTKDAASMPLSFGSVKKIHKQYQVSLYAGLREYARTHRHCCIALAIEKPVRCAENGFRAEIRRVETSLSFEKLFGPPTALEITKRHVLGPLVPFGKVTKPTTVRLTDLNGDVHEFIGEALDTTFNILIFVCPVAMFKAQ